MPLAPGSPAHDGLVAFFERGIPFNAWLGMKVERLEPGFAVVRIPFRPELVGAASADLTLVGASRVFRKVYQLIAVGNDTDCHECIDNIEVGDGDHILTMPREMLLGITRECLRLGLGLLG